MSGLERAISIAGNQTKLAEILGCHQTQVNNWVTGKRPIPIGRCKKIEEFTKKLVSRQELRPELFD